MRQALQVGIRCFNVESAAELELLSQVADDMGTVARISLRVNPSMLMQALIRIFQPDLKRTKFGVDIAAAHALYRRALSLPGVNPVGVDCHIGSQLLAITPIY